MSHKHRHRLSWVSRNRPLHLWSIDFWQMCQDITGKESFFQEMVQLLWQTGLHFLKMLTIALSYNPEIQLLGVYWERWKHTCRHTCYLWHYGRGPPGSSVHGISQAGMREPVAIPSSRGSFWPRDQICVPCFAVGGSDGKASACNTGDLG